MAKEKELKDMTVEELVKSTMDIGKRCKGGPIHIPFLLNTRVVEINRRIEESYLRGVRHQKKIMDGGGSDTNIIVVAKTEREQLERDEELVSNAIDGMSDKRKALDDDILYWEGILETVRTKKEELGE